MTDILLFDLFTLRGGKKMGHLTLENIRTREKKSVTAAQILTSKEKPKQVKTK